MRTFALAPAPLALPLAVAIFIVLAAGCDGGDEDSAFTAVRDSAGIQIVESAGPAWDDSTAWRISEAPSVQIGVEAGSEAYQLANVRSTLRLGNGTIVVMNGGSAELRYFDETGIHIATGGGQGNGPGELGSGFVDLWPWSHDSVAVWDPQNRRLTMFGPNAGTDGGTAFRFPEGVFPRPIALLPNRALVGRHSIIISGPPTGPVGRTVRDTLVFTVYPPDEGEPQELARLLTREVWNYRWRGNILAGWRLPNVPTSYVVHGAKLYYTLGERPDIQVFTLAGELVRIVRQQIPARLLTDAVRQQIIEERVQAAPDPETGRDFRAFFKDALWFDELGAYRRLLVDREDNLWAKEYPEPGTDASRWFVFDPAGHWQGTVELPDRFEPYDIGDDYVLGEWLDELDVEYVRMYALVK